MPAVCSGRNFSFMDVNRSHTSPLHLMKHFAFKLPTVLFSFLPYKLCLNNMAQRKADKRKQTQILCSGKWFMTGQTLNCSTAVVKF